MAKTLILGHIFCNKWNDLMFLSPIWSHDKEAATLPLNSQLKRKILFSEDWIRISLYQRYTGLHGGTMLCLTHMCSFLAGLYPSPKSFWSCTHVNSCQNYILYINLHFDYFLQGNFKYPRIKKIHQILEKITRID